MIFTFMFILLTVFSGNAYSSDEKKDNDIVICDYVYHVSEPENKKHPYVIYFEPFRGKYSSYKYSFNGIIWSEDVSVLEINPKLELSGKIICLSGIVSMYRNTEQIVIRSPSQISFINEEHIGVK